MGEVHYKTTNGWNCICGERVSILAGPGTQQFATHCQSKNHKAGIAPPLKPKRQLPMTQFFFAAAPLAPATDAAAPPHREIDGEHEVATSTLEVQGSALALGADWKGTGALPLRVPNAGTLCG